MAKTIQDCGKNLKDPLLMIIKILGQDLLGS